MLRRSPQQHIIARVFGHPGAICCGVGKRVEAPSKSAALICDLEPRTKFDFLNKLLSVRTGYTFVVVSVIDRSLITFGDLEARHRSGAIAADCCFHPLLGSTFVVVAFCKRHGGE